VEPGGHSNPRGARSSAGLVGAQQIISAMPDCRVLDVTDALFITVGGTRKLVDKIEANGCRQDRSQRMVQAATESHSQWPCRPLHRRVLSSRGEPMNRRERSSTPLPGRLSSHSDRRHALDLKSARWPRRVQHHRLHGRWPQADQLDIHGRTLPQMNSTACSSIGRPGTDKRGELPLMDLELQW
jgi:hypothetical protein